MKDLLTLLSRRVLRAGRTWPDARGWQSMVRLAALYAALSLSLGFASGFLKVEPPSLSPALGLGLAIRAFFAPALLEELLFRVLLYPHPGETVPKHARLAWAALALALFVLWHPLYALLLPAARPVFLEPTFLGLAALLGATCLAAYGRTGSLWPPLLIHWLTVVLWVLFLGGGALLA